MRRFDNFSLLVAAAVVVFLGGCQPAAREEAAPVAKAPEQVEEAEVHWGYEGEEGPEHWADLSPDFAACGQGVEQSPIEYRAARCRSSGG
ncbi:MAG: hypothetical protein EP299_02145 [Acidobacteria bacterium]|nr:MAG: hypothetical protein EP299_02145 [Acidobacteriota bacterium]